MEGPLQRSKYQGRAFLIILWRWLHEGEGRPHENARRANDGAATKGVPTTRKVSIDGKEKSGNTDFTVTDFTVIDKLHSAEPEKRRLQRAYLAKLLKGERIGRNEVREIEIMHAIAADLRQAARGWPR